LDRLNTPKLLHLALGDYYTHPLRNATFVNLQTLDLGDRFNRHLTELNLPNLKQLRLSHRLYSDIMDQDLRKLPFPHIVTDSPLGGYIDVKKL
jgi:hypothetical protein